MIGWNKAKSPKQPHVPLKQLQTQLLKLGMILQVREKDAKRPDDWWRDKNKVPFRVLAKRAHRLEGIVKERSKTAASRKAWNGAGGPWKELTAKQEAALRKVATRQAATAATAFGMTAGKRRR